MKVAGRRLDQLWGMTVGLTLALFAATLGLTVYCDGLMVGRVGDGFVLGSGAVQLPADPTLGAFFYLISRGLVAMIAIAIALSALVGVAAEGGLPAAARSLWAPTRTPAGTVIDIGKMLLGVALGYLILKIGLQAFGRA
jgi:hypothetical protein